MSNRQVEATSKKASIKKLDEENMRWGLFTAYIQAANSPDKSNQVGAVIETVGHAVITAFNNYVWTPPRDANTIISNERLHKYRYIEHAEKQVIYKAAMNGLELRDATMFAPWASCIECAKAIVLSGIKQVVYHGWRDRQTPERWREDIREAKDLMYQSGVKLHCYEGEFDIEVIVNGQKVKPGKRH